MRKIVAFCTLFIIVISLSACGTFTMSAPICIPNEIKDVTVTHIESGRSYKSIVNRDDLQKVRSWLSCLKCEQRYFRKGSTPGDAEGGEAYIFSFDNRSELDFTYVINDKNDCYLLVDEEWYYITHPSNPPILSTIEIDARDHDASQESMEQFAKKEILHIISEEPSGCTWSEETETHTPVALYDPYGNCNGYVFKLNTGGSETGYIQINCFDGTTMVYCYSFTGIPAYKGLSNIYEDQVADSKDGRLYFFGNMTYCVRTKDDAFRALDDVELIDFDEAKKHYDSFLSTILGKQTTLRVVGNHRQELDRITDIYYSLSFQIIQGGLKMCRRGQSAIPRKDNLLACNSAQSFIADLQNLFGR